MQKGKIIPRSDVLRKEREFPMKHSERIAHAEKLIELMKQHPGLQHREFSIKLHPTNRHRLHIIIDGSNVYVVVVSPYTMRVQYGRSHITTAKSNNKLVQFVDTAVNITEASMLRQQARNDRAYSNILIKLRQQRNSRHLVVEGDRPSPMVAFPTIKLYFQGNAKLLVAVIRCNHLRAEEEDISLGPADEFTVSFEAGTVSMSLDELLFVFSLASADTMDLFMAKRELEGRAKLKEKHINHPLVIADGQFALHADSVGYIFRLLEAGVTEVNRRIVKTSSYPTSRTSNAAVDALLSMTTEHVIYCGHIREAE